MAKRILVIDDEETIRDMFELILGKAGYEVICVQDGITARAKLESESFDLVFLDILLPDCHGSELFKQIKTVRAVPVVCIITAMTSADYERVEDYSKLIHLGAKDKFLRKPIGKDELLKATAELLTE